MATVKNSVDKILQAATTRTTNLPTAQVILSCITNIFHVTAAGANDPASITFYGSAIDLEGPIVFACTGGTLTSITATSATLTYANMAAATATVTATVTSNGQPYSDGKFITKVQDGAAGGKGDTGPSGPLAMMVNLYQWSSVAPAAPLGTSTLTWATVTNSAYSTSDGWSVTVPSNPGTPGVSLFIAAKPVTAAGGTVSTTVSYGGATVSAWAQNGTSGLQSFAPTVYQWAATIPAGPAGAATLTWASGAFGAAPTNWSLTPGTAPSPGFTLFAGRVQVSDTAANASTGFNWSTAAVMAIGYAGAEGSSYVTAYCASATGSTTTAPAATTGRASLPAANSGGLAGTYSATVPALAAGQYLYQTDGIYNPATDQIIWSIPYWSSLKVATLSAITANLGAINAGSINLGGGVFTVDNAGNLVCSSITIKKPDGTVLFTSGAGLTAAGAEPAGKLNKNADDILQGQIAVQAGGAVVVGTAAWSGATPSGTGVVISTNGIAGVNNGKVGFSVSASGDATFGGALSGATGNFAGNVITGTGTSFRCELGPDDPVYAMWIGSGVKSDATAVFYIKRGGAGYFGGSLSAGTLKTSVSNPSIAANAEIIDGPFGSNGKPINVVVGYDFSLLLSSTKHTYSAAQTPVAQATVQLYSGTTLIQTVTFNGSTSVSNSSVVEEQSTADVSIGGSFTYVDSSGSTANRTFRAVITNRQYPAITFATTKTGGVDNQDSYYQRLSITTTEQ